MIFEKIVIAFGIILVHVINGTSIFDIGTSIKPDFMILLVSFFALRKGGMSGLWIGFFGGLLSDAALGGEQGIEGRIYYKIGIHTMSFSVLGYLLGKFGRTSYNENFVSISIYAFIMTLITRLFTYVLFSFFFHSNSNYSFLATSIYNAAIAPLTFFMLSWIYKLETSEGIR